MATNDSRAMPVRTFRCLDDLSQDQLVELADLLDRQAQVLTPMWRQYIFAYLQAPDAGTWEDAYLAPVGRHVLLDAVLDQGMPSRNRMGKFWSMIPTREMVFDALRANVVAAD